MQSTETAVLMDDAPRMPSNFVSIWQTDSIALRFTRWLNWGLAGDDAVAYPRADGSGGQSFRIAGLVVGSDNTWKSSSRKS